MNTMHIDTPHLAIRVRYRVPGSETVAHAAFEFVDDACAFRHMISEKYQGQISVVLTHDPEAIIWRLVEDALRRLGSPHLPIRVRYRVLGSETVAHAAFESADDACAFRRMISEKYQGQISVVLTHDIWQVDQEGRPVPHRVEVNT